MPLTKKQKGLMIDDAGKKLSQSKSAVFVEFNKVGVEDFKKLRRELKVVGAGLKIMKKRLLSIALKNSGILFNPTEKKDQLGTVFAKGDLSSVASIVYKFAKDLVRAKKGNFAVLGYYDENEKKVFDQNEFKVIAMLPSREILLAQIAMMLTMPIKQTMMVLNERAKQVVNN